MDVGEGKKVRSETDTLLARQEGEGVRNHSSPGLDGYTGKEVILGRYNQKGSSFVLHRLHPTTFDIRRVNKEKEKVNINSRVRWLRPGAPAPLVLENVDGTTKVERAEASLARII